MSLAVVLGAYTTRCLVPWGFVMLWALLSMTMFDAPGSDTDPLTFSPWVSWLHPCCLSPVRSPAGPRSSPDAKSS